MRMMQEDTRLCPENTPVRVLPEDWHVVPLGSIAHLKNGYAFKSSTYTPGGKYRVVTIANVQDGYMEIQKCSTISSLPPDIQPHQIISVGDVLISMTGNVGRVCRATENNCLLNQRVGKLVPINFDASFIFQVLSQRRFQNTMMEQATGGAQGNLSVADINDFTVIVPINKFEQRAIAAALSDVDALISSLDALIAKKRDIKQGAMQDLLSGRRRLPWFDDEWRTTTFGEAFSFLKTGINSRADLGQDGEVGYIHYGDVHASKSPRLDCSLASIPRISMDRVAHLPLIRDGDLIIADASEDYEGIGKSVEICGLQGRQVVAGLHTLLLRGRADYVSNGFKAYIQFNPAIKRALIRVANGISVYGIGRTSVKSIEIRLPPPKEQTAIATVLSDMDAEIDALAAKRDKMCAIKQGMMQELLTGRKRLI
jgi:type I restriction enzyme S subunit